MADEHMLLLGEIKGKLDLVIGNQTAHASKLDGLDTRLRKVETRAAVGGALSGGLVSVGVAIMVEKGKTLLGI